MIFLQPRTETEERRALLDLAHAEARRRGAPVLAAHTRTIEPAGDALGLYALAVAAGLDAVYWEQPSRGSVLVAAGVAHRHDLRDGRRFADAAAAWRALAAGAVCDRRDELAAFAGFRFDAGSAHAEHWRAFGDGTLVVPELLYRCDDGGARVTLAAMTGPRPQADGFRLHRFLDEAPGALARRDPAVARIDHTVDAGRWSGAVTALTAAIGAGRVQKVVLAREIVLHATDAIDETAALARLREGYRDCTIFAFRRGDACFLGATPERLVRLEGRRVRVTCLAGSARRGADAADDEAAATALLADEKERREHNLVLRAITGALAPLCRELHVPAAPALMRMPHVQHLYTPVEGTLADDAGLLDLAGRLHPTPAVGGLPLDEALALIREHEPFDRGWYAGPVGWLDARGDGELAVALRSGLVRRREARLFAGCGIVSGSDPLREYEESTMKLRPMLWALGQG